MFRLPIRELMGVPGVSLPPRQGAEFDTDALDVRRARYRILRVTAEEAELTRVGFLPRLDAAAR